MMELTEDWKWREVPATLDISYSHIVGEHVSFKRKGGIQGINLEQYPQMNVPEFTNENFCFMNEESRSSLDATAVSTPCCACDNKIQVCFDQSRC